MIYFSKTNILIPQYQAVYTISLISHILLHYKHLTHSFIHLHNTFSSATSPAKYLKTQFSIRFYRAYSQAAHKSIEI